MTDTLFLRFIESIDDEAAPIEWGVVSDASQTFRARGEDVSVSDIVDTAREELEDADWNPDEVVMVLPASATLITEVSIAARRRSQIRRALPYVVEEQLADDIDDVHLALGPVEAQQPVPVVAIDKRLLRDWVERVSAAGLVADAAVPDALLAPHHPGHVSIHLDGADALVRAGNDASRVQRDLLAQMVAFMGAKLGAQMAPEEPLEITVVSEETQKPDDLTLARLESELSGERPVTVTPEIEEADLFQRLCRSYRTRAPLINLLQGEFQPVRRRGQARLARFSWAAVLLVVWIVAYLGFTAAEAYMLERKAHAMEAQAIALYREWFPNDRRVTSLNIRDRTLAHIKTGAAEAAEDEFFGLLSAIARQLESKRGAGVHRIGYNESSGQLSLELSADGYPTVEAITDGLKANGIDVEITSVSPDEEGVRAHLRLGRS